MNAGIFRVSDKISFAVVAGGNDFVLKDVLVIDEMIDQ
jgi:hypothetical protein